MAVKETLQLRHQLVCNGICIRAATYDTRRHHMLTYDTQPLMPHTLRLFSLRREIKYTKIFDEENPPPVRTTDATEHGKSHVDKEVVVHSLTLQYAPKLDVYICVYSAQTVALVAKGSSSSKSGVKNCCEADTRYNVLFLEPASLRKLVYYPGPVTHLLRCVYYDTHGDQLVLAVRMKEQQSSIGSTDHIDSQEQDGGPMRNLIDILQISKRPFQSSTTQPMTPADGQESRMMLCVVKAKMSMLHADTVEYVCGSAYLRQVYGTGSFQRATGAPLQSFVVEWRENAEQTLVLIRRILHQDVITAITVSPCGMWFFTGHSNGMLKMWNTSNGNTVLYGFGSEPYQPQNTISHAAAISLVEFHSPSTSSVSMSEAMVITSDRETGTTKHWRFSATHPVDLDQNGNTIEQYKRESTDMQRLFVLELVGHYTTQPRVAATSQISSMKKHRVRDAIPILTICVNIDMGSFLECLLLVFRKDVIHVLKVQCVMNVLETLAHHDEVYFIRAVDHHNEQKIVCLSGGQVDTLRIIPLHDPPLSSKSQQYLIACPLHESARVSSMECIVVSSQVSFIVCGWSNGIVEIRDAFKNKRVMLLQDPRLNDHVSTLAVILFQKNKPPNTMNGSKASVPPLVASSPNASAQMWGGLLRGSKTLGRAEVCMVNDATSCAGLEDPQTSVFYVMAGTASGHIFGWKVAINTAQVISTNQLLLESNMYVNGAHSTHIVQMAEIDSGLNNSTASLASMGADGIAKFWRVPSMTMLGCLNTGVGSDVSMASCLASVGFHRGESMLSVGFENGRLSVWRMNTDKMRFVELEVSARHERRISRITTTTAVSTSSNVEFLTCSLDMTVILWTIVGESVQEKRYFEVGAPVIDLCVSGAQIMVALAHEICKFTYSVDSADPSTSTTADKAINTSASKEQASGIVLTVATATQQDDRKDEDDQITPYTTTSRSNAESDGLDGIYEQLPRSFNEDLPLQIPSPFTQEREQVISIPSMPSQERQITGDIKSQLTMNIDCRSKIESQSVGSINGWKTENTNEFPLHGEVLYVYVQQFIESHGSKGTIMAGLLSDFFSLQRLCKRQTEYAVRMCLKEMKLDIKSRLDVYQACEVLEKAQVFILNKADLTLQAVPKNVKRKQMELIRSRKKHEREMMKRKPIITYNILGEKSIRWEIVESTSKSCKSTNQSDDSRAQAIMIPDSPTASIHVPTDLVIPPSVESTFTGTFEANGDDQFASNAKIMVEARHTRKRNRKKSIAERVRSVSKLVFPNEDLVNSLMLSRKFQKHWSRGYCWCSYSSKIYVVWEDPGDVYENGSCERCKKRIHKVKLSKTDQGPHFSLRSTMGIIADVYTVLTAPSHDLLYTNNQQESKRTTYSVMSIHDALVEVFVKKYGMQDIVETKLKLFFVSMCNYVRMFDAVAVLGELLGLYVLDNATEADQAPDELAALCACSYSWAYTREMVVNGDTHIGKHGSDHNGVSNHSMASALVDIENGKRTNWQFLRLDNALLCAQDILMYPLVSPGFLQNILTYAGEYAQNTLSNPHDKFSDERDNVNARDRWIEIHRYLRLLVGEWRQQNMEFRAVEQLLFIHPQNSLMNCSSPEPSPNVLEKLRLILSCFVFSDHDRVGVMNVNDFERILRKLRYLWPNENVTEEEAAMTTAKEVSLTFENTILSAKQRFADVNRDGQLCYLDFWVMLYIVGVKGNDLLKFREIPSFCRDYKLEVAPDLQQMVVRFMQCSCTLLLPKGVRLGKSSMDQRVNHQHRRRVAGLHDGLFVMKNELGLSLSMQTLLAVDPEDRTLASHNHLVLDGSAPALRQSASVSAMDRFRPLSHGSDENSKNHGMSRRLERMKPTVFGVRPSGPTNKTPAILHWSALENEDLGSGKQLDTAAHMTHTVMPGTSGPLQQTSSVAPSLSSALAQTYSNVYIQFPHIDPQRHKVQVATKESTSSIEHIKGHLEGDEDIAVNDWHQLILKEHEEDEEERAKVQQMESTLVTREYRRYSIVQPLLPPRRASRSDIQLNDATKKPTVSKHIAALKEPKQIPVNPSSAPIQSTVVRIPMIEKSLSPKLLIDPATDIGNNGGVSVHTLNHSMAVPVNEEPPTEIAFQEPNELLEPDGDDASDPELLPQDDMITLEKMIPSLIPENDNLVASSSQESLIYTDKSSELINETDEQWENLNEEVGDSIENDEIETVTSEYAEGPDVDESIVTITRSPSIDATVYDEIQMDTNQMVEDTVSTIEPIVMESSPVSNTTEEVEDPASIRIAPTLDSIAILSTGKSAANQGNTIVAPIPSPVDNEDKPTQSAIAVSPANKVKVQEPEHPIKQALPMLVSANPHATKPNSNNIGITKHHTFRFSQQPRFRTSASIINNPFRSGQWGPGVDEYSSDDENAFKWGDSDDNEDDDQDVGDIEIQLTREMDRLAAHAKRSRRRSSIFQHRRISTKTIGLTALAVSPRPVARERRSISKNTEHEDTDINNDINPIERSAGASTCLDEDVGRALYGEHLVDALEEGIVFSLEAEASMQDKWKQFFSDSEVTMFSSLKEEYQVKQELKRQDEERQSKLMKKRLEQQARDSERLQKSQHKSAVLTAATEVNNNNDDHSTDNPIHFRLRRLTRESCCQLQTEIRYGELVKGECKHVNDIQYYHFYYFPETNGSIITLKLHLDHGDAEVLMSTDTKVPCSTDFMWRSVENASIGQDGDGKKIVLYPHDLMHLVTSADAIDSASGAVAFYLSVIALEPETHFTLSVMASVQKTEPSRAMQTVDLLIDRFNQFSKSFQGIGTYGAHLKQNDNEWKHATVSPSSMNEARLLRRMEARSRKRERARRRGQPVEDASSDEPDVNEDCTGNNSDTADGSERNSSEDESVGDSKSFQHLLESINERTHQSQEKSRSKSFVLAGPSADQVSFIEDEIFKLQQMSPKPTCEQTESLVADPLAAKIQQSVSRWAKRLSVNKRVQRRLSPLKAGAHGNGVSFPSANASLRVAQFAPKPVAYSLSNLSCEGQMTKNNSSGQLQRKG